MPSGQQATDVQEASGSADLVASGGVLLALAVAACVLAAGAAITWQVTLRRS